MDILKIPNGGSTGMRLYGDDFEFMQTGIQEAITAVNKRFIDANGGSLVLSGCNFNEVTAGTYNITGGWVVIGGQIAYFVGDAVTFTGAVDFSTVELELYTYDFPSAPVFRDVDGVSYTPWKRTQARLKTGAGITVNLGNASRIENVMRSVLGSTDTIVADALTLESGVSVDSGTNIKLSKVGQKAFLFANLVSDATVNYAVNGGVKIAQLPSGFNPIQLTAVMVGCTSRTVGYLYLKTNGDVHFENTTSTLSSGNVVYLNAHYLTP